MWMGLKKSQKARSIIDAYLFPPLHKGSILLSLPRASSDPRPVEHDIVDYEPQSISCMTIVEESIARDQLSAMQLYVVGWLYNYIRKLPGIIPTTSSERVLPPQCQQHIQHGACYYHRRMYRVTLQIR
jgi:hypothetical protein